MAGEGDAERLVVLLEARIKDFEKNMAKASGTATKSYAGMRRGSKTATGRMEADMVKSTGSINRALAATSAKIGGFGKSLIAGFAGGIIAGGVAGIVSQIGQVASAITAIGDEAKRSGLSLQSFQEWGVVARDNRIPIDAMVDAFKELSIRADEFATTGGGSAADAFARLGMSREEVQERLKNPSDLMLEIIERTQALGDAAAGIRILDEVLGGQGAEQFTNLMGQSREQIEATIQRGHELGQVIEQELVDKAADLDSAFRDVTNTVGTGLQQAIVNASWALFDFMQQFKAMEDRTTTSLESRLDGLGRDIVGKDRERMQALSEARSNPDMAGLQTGFATQLEQEINDLRAEEATILKTLQDRKIPLTEPGASIPPTVAVPTLAGGGGGSRSSAASEAEKQAKAVQNIIAGLEFERSLIGLSAIEQAKLTAIRQAGAAATGDQRDMIGQLVEANIIEQQNIDNLTSMYDMLGQAGMGAVQGIIGAMEDGKVTTEEWGSILSDVLGMASQFFLNAAFSGLGGGGGGGFNFGKMFGFASGTANTGGAPGEPRGIVHGQEAVIPLPSGGKVPVQLSGANSQSAQRVEVDVTVTMDANGHFRAFVEQKAAETSRRVVNRYNDALEDVLPAAVQRIGRDPYRAHVDLGVRV